ncbi:hypothetical protein RB195_000034 [Necator americanus]|uniref:Uncharacterized protein n=1 Tax=Necator americanus TaxID=51031 RepID=A0ABR1D8A7_NECAM
MYRRTRKIVVTQLHDELKLLLVRILSSLSAFRRTLHFQYFSLSRSSSSCYLPILTILIPRTVSGKPDIQSPAYVASGEKNGDVVVVWTVFVAIVVQLLPSTELL